MHASVQCSSRKENKMNYMKKVLDLANEKIIDSDKPNIYHIGVFHDDWCDIFKGGSCNCNPEVKLTAKYPYNKWPA